MTSNDVEKKIKIERQFDKLKQPLNYFKKLNILPIELIEEEIEEKYFTREDLYMSNIKIFKNNNILHPISNYSLRYPWSGNDLRYTLLYSFGEVYNIDINLLDKHNVLNDILLNLDKYKDNGVLVKCLYDCLYKQILECFNKKYEEITRRANEYMNTKNYKIKLDDLQADMYIKFSEVPAVGWHHLYNLWIKKICSKTIKYTEYYDSDNIRLIKKQTLQDMFNSCNYRVYKIDKNNIHNIFGTYLYDEDNNLILE